MATRQSAKVAAGTPAKGLRVGLVSVEAAYSVGAALSLSAGDVIQMVNVPSGARLIYCALSGGSGDALCALGDGISNNRYIDYGTMGSSTSVVRQITLHSANVGYQYSTDDTIDVFVSTVSVGSITGGFHLRVIYSMDTA